MMNTEKWKNKVAVITGAASGIGEGLARYCARLGMNVIAADVDEEGLNKLKNEFADNMQTTVLDVRQESDVDALAETVFSQYGAVHLLFNNAGVLVDGKSWERSARDWKWVIDVNVMGVVYGIRAFIPRMLKQKDEGRIINTSSIGGLLGGGAYLATYQGTKHMITSMTESLYQELQAESAPISASVLCPAEVATGIWESDRLRPEEEKNVLTSSEEQMLHDVIAEGVAAGLSPNEFAQRVFEGIDANKFWLLPQPEFKEQFESRHVSIINETNPISMFEMLGLQTNEK